MSGFFSVRVGCLLLGTFSSCYRDFRKDFGVVVHNICIRAASAWGRTRCSSGDFGWLSLAPTADKHQHLHLVQMHLLMFSLCLCSVGCWVESPQPQLFIITVMKTYTLPLLHHTFAITLEFVFHLRHNIFSLFNIWTTEPRRQQRGERCQVFTGSKCLTDLMWLITQNLHYLNLFIFFFQFLLTTGSQGKLR